MLMEKLFFAVRKSLPAKKIGAVTAALFGGFCLVACVGCADRPELGTQAYGTVVNKLPFVRGAEEPFHFPYAGDNDHRNCEFKEEDPFQ